jgi:CheY-like chemotaxis protein
MPTILFIDDHTCESRTVAHKLQACGFEVQVAPDDEEAQTLFRLYPIDAVVMDCHPEMPGRGIIAPSLRGIRRDVPIIMMSAFCRLPCRRLQYADACIQKGNFTGLLSALRLLLCARAYGLCQAVAQEGMLGIRWKRDHQTPNAA